MRIVQTVVLALALIPLAAIARGDETGRVAVTGSPKPTAADWPAWRGPTTNGIAAESKAPIEFNETKNVAWKTPIPGRGHSTPTIVGERIVLLTADEQVKVQSVLCYDRKTGVQRWRVDLHKGDAGWDKSTNRKNTHASSTVASDGTRLFVVFLHDKALMATALDLDGKQLWQTKVGDYVSHHGYSASPFIYKDTVLVSGDHKGEGGGYLASLKRESGEIVWKNSRPAAPNYPSPIVYHVSGRDQILMAGADIVASYDPGTGKELWRTKGTTTECVGTVAVDGNLAFASGGYPDSETVAVKTDGGGVAWKNKVKVYVPTLLTRDGYVYAVNDGGVAYCWKAATGEQMWNGRVKGGYSASPILVGDLLYTASESGIVTILKASPKEFEIVAKNQVGSDVFATPVVCGGQLFLRVGKSEGGKRQEYLVCIGQAPAK